MPISDNQPTFIEEFRQTQPDWANGNNINGDPDPNVDWLPAFQRAAFEHLVTDNADHLRFQRTYQRLVFVGRTRGIYKLSGTLDLFGLRLEGLYPGVRLIFDQGTDGIHIHYPSTPPGPGTSFNLPSPIKDYGGKCTLRNLDLSGTGAIGTRGVIVQDGSLLDAVVVRNFGWHGFHVTADAQHRTINSIDGALSNANGTTLLDCQTIQCGGNPGTDVRAITTANPNGNRIFGSGVRFEGGDSNQCYSRSFYAYNCAGWAIDDVSYLGNQHDLPQAVDCFHVIADWEEAIRSHPQATDIEQRDFGTDFIHISTGFRVNLAYHMANVTARGIMISPYVEDAHPPARVDVRPNSFIVGGRGGLDSDHTTRVSRGASSNNWRFVGTETPESDVTVLREGHGVFLSLVSDADEGGRQPYRLKYAHFAVDRVEEGPKSDDLAGFYRLDRANLDDQIALALTGDQSYEKTGLRVATRKLDAGRLVLFRHYRAINYTHYRSVEYGSSPDLVSLEAALPAADRQIGDAYINLIPSAGSIYEAVVIKHLKLGTNVWVTVSKVPN